MAKPRSIYVCNECGGESSQWFGKCPSCGVFNSLVEQQAVTIKAGGGRFAVAEATKTARTSHNPPQSRAAVTFTQISDSQEQRWSSGYLEFDRVLGGGLVPGSLVLIGGDPGIGKSTLLLQTASQLAIKNRVLYVCGEESSKQIKLRAGRLGIAVNDPDSNLYVLAETNLEEVLAEIVALQPQVAIIDSIQTVYLPNLTSAAGSVAQVRECTASLMQVAKRQDTSVFLVGHVTKEGAIAGPKVLEHLVDTVLYFEGDRFAVHRLLRSVKNRFGATHEIGVFEMVDKGLIEVSNPSQLFLGNLEEQSSGSSIVVACEGTRPLVVELQALVSPTSYPSPRRATTGMDYNRLVQILAVLEKRVGIPLSKLDAYLAVAGGLTVNEPAVDLGMALAIVASFRDRTISPHTVAIGEVGLGGQIRPVSQLELRLREAVKLGFKKAIVPKSNSLPTVPGLELLPVAKLVDAIVAGLPVDR
jgi:DNA repair protein RadA/Sms